MAIAPSLKREISVLSGKFDDVLDGFNTRNRRKVLRKGAAILRKAARTKVEIASEDVFRYSTARVTKSIRTPKGKGNVVAVYKPSNLKKAIATMTFRRDKTGVYVGAKRGKSQAIVQGTKAANADGYYAHFLEFGTINSAAYPFMRPALAATKGAIKAKITEESRKLAAKIKRETRL